MKEMHLFEVKGIVRQKDGDFRDRHYRQEDFKVVTINKSFTEAETTAVKYLESIKDIVVEKIKLTQLIAEDIEIQCDPIESIEYKGVVIFNK